MLASSKPMANARPRTRIASASRSGADPRRAGSLRLAALSVLIAAAVGGATYMATRTILEGRALTHLETLRDVAHRDLTRMMDGLGEGVSTAATDPRAVTALDDFGRAIHEANVDIDGLDPSTRSELGAKLKSHYEGLLAEAPLGSIPEDVSLETIYPGAPADEKASPEAVLQAIYLTGDAAGQAPSVAGGYGRARARQHAWLAAMAAQNGWDDLWLVDASNDRVVYALNDGGLETFTSLKDGPHRGGGLARAVSRAAAAPGSKDVALADAAGGPLDSTPRLYLTAPVTSNGRRVGYLIAGVGADRIDQALLPGEASTRWKRAGLEYGGDVRVIGPDGRPRSSERQPEKRRGDAKAILAKEPAGVREALSGSAETGSYDQSGRTVLGSYAPIEVGTNRWVIAAEEPRSAALAPLRVLIPILAVIAVIAGALGWVFGARLWRQFAGGLRQLSDVVQRAQRGDTTARLESKASGPVGELSSSIDRLLEERAGAVARSEQETQRLAGEIDAILDAAREVSSGNLSARAPAGAGTLGAVATAFNEALDSIKSLSDRLESTSSRIGQSASQIKTAAEGASTEAASQARECSSTAGAAETMRAQCSGIAETCSGALEVARRTQQVSQLGQTALQDLLGGMDGLQREARAATVKIKRLGERSMQISAIIGTISKMSAQTDMLALNAAIEASRAGENGQGFNLVADEVRKLAERAAAAAKEIERLIGGIQSDIGEAVGGMERQGERIEMHAAAAGQAQHALERVVAATNESAATIETIASNAQAQAEAAAKLGGAVSRIGESATGVQRSSDQAKRSSSELLGLSQELLERAGATPS